jgi:hypothetical protein
VDQDRAEDRAFGFEIVRERTLRGSNGSLWHWGGRNRTTVAGLWANPQRWRVQTNDGGSKKQDPPYADNYILASVFEIAS